MAALASPVIIAKNDSGETKVGNLFSSCLDFSKKHKNFSKLGFVSEQQLFLMLDESVF